jgi:hypothetical protein
LGGCGYGIDAWSGSGPSTSYTVTIGRESVHGVEQRLKATL